jgi:hypothetical protein
MPYSVNINELKNGGFENPLQGAGFAVYTAGIPNWSGSEI